MEPCKFAAFALILLTTTSAYAEDLVTDRPDATESSSAVAPGLVQVETGFQASANAGVSVVERPLTLFRVGLASFAELRVEPPSMVSLDGATLFTDPSIGAKFAGDIGDVSAAGVIVQSSLPVVNAGSGATLTAIATGATELGPVSTGINLGVSFGPITDDGGTQQFEGLATLAFGYGLSEKVGAFLEGYVTIPEEGEVSPVIDGGFTYVLAPWIQLDAYGGAGLTRAAPDWLAGGGVSVRLPLIQAENESGE